MKSYPTGWLDGLRNFWRAFGPVGAASEPLFVRLSDTRTELRWVGPPLVFDTRSSIVTRKGRPILKFDDIRSIDIKVFVDDDCTRLWRVCLKTGLLPGECMGVTRDDADASIVAARIATLTGRRVRSL